MRHPQTLFELLDVTRLREEKREEEKEDEEQFPGIVE